MKKVILFLVLGFLVFSVFVSAEAIQDSRYGLLAATQYNKDSKVVKFENRIGVIENVNAQTGQISFTSRKTEGGIKSKDQFNIQTPITVKKPRGGAIEKTAAGKQALINQEVKVTQPQALKQIQNSDLLKTTGQVSRQINVDTSIKNLFLKILNYFRN